MGPFAFIRRAHVASRFMWAICALAVLAILYSYWLHLHPPKYQAAAVFVYPQRKIRAITVAMAFSPDDTRLVSALHGDNGPALISWDLQCGVKSLSERPSDELKSYQECRLEINPSDQPTAVKFSPDGKQLFVGFGDCKEGCFESSSDEVVYGSHGSVRFLDPVTFEERKRIDLDWSVYGIAISDDGTQLAAIGSGKERTVNVGLWDALTGKEKMAVSFSGIPAVVGGADPLQTIVFSHNGQLLFVATVSAFDAHASDPLSSKPDGIVQEIDTSTDKVFDTWTFPRTPITWIEVAPNDSEVFVGPNEMPDFPALCHIDPKTGRFINRESTFWGVAAGHILRNGRDALRARNSGHPGAEMPASYVVRKFDLATTGTLTEFWGFYESLRSFAVSNDENWMAVGDTFGYVNVWKVPQE